MSQAVCVRRNVAANGRRRSGRERQLDVLVRAARAGDPNAWRRLVQRFDGMLRRLAHSYRLTPSDVDDVVQQTWLVLFEAIDQIREPAAIGAWLATTLRRIALRHIQIHVREQLTDDPRLGDTSDGEHPEARLLALERHVALTSALSSLPERHRDLLRILFHAAHPRIPRRCRSGPHADRQHWSHPRAIARAARTRCAATAAVRRHGRTADTTLRLIRAMHLWTSVLTRKSRRSSPPIHKRLIGYACASGLEHVLNGTATQAVPDADGAIPDSW
jgi:RNA polymerase sigma factor (sigma-70 family)